jgi:peroxiredoxin Q/BCP
MSQDKPHTAGTPQIGQPVSDFHAQATSQKDFLLSACAGYNIVLYFYPRDATPGCTQESQDFRDLYESFKEEDTCIFGISRDSLVSHEKFKAKHEFPFELISDSDETLCKLFDVIKEKNMYGKMVLGIERSTFLIDQQGVLQKAWRGVRVKGHAEEVLQAVRQLNKAVA